MLNISYQPALLIIIFNRPEITRKLLERLREIKPKKIYISADGARTDKKGEKELCEQTRALFETIDWPCEVTKRYLDTNMGCDPHIISAVNWFFEHEESGIILEDDCLPHPSFFTFCHDLLETYKDDTKIMHINGSNFQFGNTRGDGSYYFSRYAHSWGWATWKRAWVHYDTSLSHFPEFKKSRVIDSILSETKEKKFWINFFNKIHEGKYPFWDAHWIFSIWNQDGVVITPNVNLIKNIGFGKEATHTSSKERIMEQGTFELREIISPSSSDINKNADRFTFKVYYYRTPLQKILHKLNSLFT